MSSLTHEIVDLLDRGESFVLATIVSRNGSAPRTAGAQMIIYSDGRVTGTIGGGLLEAKTISAARDVFKNHIPILREFLLTGKDAASTDMICGGRQEALIEFMDAADHDLLSAFNAANLVETTRQKGWWICQLPSPSEPELSCVPRWFIAADGTVTSRPGACATTNVMLQLSQGDDQTHGSAILLEVDKAVVNMGYPREAIVTKVGNHRFSIDSLWTYGSVYIFGAGHVSQKLAVLTDMVGFRTVVLDDREEFANRARFPKASEIVVLKDNKTAFDEITLDSESYIVIVTRGHLHDKVILEQALKTDAIYVGMIGSKQKREEIYRALEAAGVDRAKLEMVHSPIGLPIGAESPEEIAVSITAELVKSRVDHLAQHP